MPTAEKDSVLDDPVYPFVSGGGLVEVGIPSMKSFIMKIKPYLTNLMKTLEKGPKKKAVKDFAKLLGKKAADAVENNPFFKETSAKWKDGVTVYTNNVPARLGRRELLARGLLLLDRALAWVGHPA